MTVSCGPVAAALTMADQKGNLWKNYRNRKTMRKPLILKPGTNGRTPEPPKISKVIPKSGAPFAIGKWTVCAWVLLFEKVQKCNMPGKFPGLLLPVYRGIQHEKCVQRSNARKYANRHYLTRVLSGELRFFWFILVDAKQMHCALTFWMYCAYNDL